MKLLKLTQDGGGDVIVNFEHVVTLSTDDDTTRLTFVYGLGGNEDELLVTDSVESILARLQSNEVIK